MNKKVLSLLTIAFAMSSAIAQKAPDWHLKDKAKDGYYGISLSQAYDFLKTKKIKSSKVIVAIIDSGLDTLHEDINAVRWANTKEIASNDLDDDKNGYIDDTNGWNFLGGKDGKNVIKDSYEGARVYHRFKSKYDGKEIEESQLSKTELYEYQMWKRAKDFVIGDGNGVDVTIYQRAYKSMQKSDSVLQVGIGKAEFTGNELDAFIPQSDAQKKAKNEMLGIMKGNGMMETKNSQFMKDFKEFVQGELKKEEAKTTAPEDFRANAVGDEESNWNTKGYGNNNLMVEKDNAMHGTHVSGIVAAIRTNNKGANGVADNVAIMTLRAVPDGDEHDKDVAYAIRYAVDNGAKVVNMSFGKSFSPEKKWVDDAVEYAQQKGVLLVHGSGNDGKNLDESVNYNFPNARLLNGKQVTNWIEVGANGDPKLGGIAASFSNYGKKNVDVFAPGVFIYSTLPGGNVYGDLQGTSMASPVVAGLAALIKSYFPKLTPEQIKKCIESSVTKINTKVVKPGTESDMITFTSLCKTGGIVNALNAVKAAYKMSGGK